MRLEIAVNEAFVEPTIEAILKGARHGDGIIGDGKIFVLPLQEVDPDSGPESAAGKPSSLAADEAPAYPTLIVACVFGWKVHASSRTGVNARASGTARRVIGTSSATRQRCRG